MDLSNLSDAELEGIASGDLSNLSDSTLEMLSAQAPQPKQPETQSQQTPRRPQMQPFTLMGQEPSFVPETSQEAKEFSSGFKTGTQKTAPAVARYGLPVAAGIVAAPVVAPLGVIGGAAALAGVGAASSAVGETAAQGLEIASGERESMSGRDIAAQTAIGATPFVPAGAGVLGKTAARVGINAAAAAGTSVLSQKIRGEDVDTGTWALPAGIAGGFSFLGAAGRGAGVLGEMRQNLQDKRFGGTVALQEVIPGFAPLENEVYKLGSVAARRTIDNLDANFAEGIKNAFPGVPDIAQKITDELGPQIGRVQGLKVRYDAALKAEQAAKEAADAAMAQGSQQYPFLREKAKQAGLVALRDYVEAQQGARQLFPPTLSQSIDEVNTGAQQAMLQKLDAGIKEARKSGLGALYEQAGIGINDPVIDLPTVLASIEAKAKDKASPLFGNIQRQKTVDMITRAFGEATMDGAEAGSQVLTREGLMNFADSVAESLVREGKDPRRAERAAAEIYGVVKDASRQFIAQNRSDALAAFDTANEAAAKMFTARRTDLADAIVNAEPTAIVDRFIKEGGNGKAVQEINRYVSAIEALGPEYANVAKEFRQGVSNVLRAGILQKANAGRAGGGWGNVAKVYDFKEVSKIAQSLADTGFPVESLGFGTRDQIKELARISSAFTPGGMTAKEFDAYQRISPVVGANAAGARIAFNRAAREDLVMGGYGNMRARELRLTRLAKQAKMSTEQVNRELAAAQNDPVAQLLYKTDLKLSPDPVKNTDWVSSVLTMEPGVVREFTKVMKASGRTALLDQIKTSAKAEVMKDLIESSDATVSAKRLKEMFFGVSETATRQREAFKELVEPAEYENLRRNFVAPLASAIQVQQGAASGVKQNLDALAGLMILEGARQGKVTTGAIRAMALIRTVRGANTTFYNLMNKVFVDPKTAPKFARAGYAMDKIMQQPELVAALKIAQIQDENAAKERTQGQ